jgi:hypothetical protein
MLATAEATVMAERAGVDLAQLYEILTHATGDCVAVRTRLPAPGVIPESPASNGWAPGFMTDLMAKDLDLAIGYAARSGSPLLTSGLVRQILGAASDTLPFTRATIETELNSTPANPAVILAERRIVSVGNLDVVPVAAALDFARIALATVVTSAAERTVKLLQSPLSGLPAGLAAEGVAPQQRKNLKGIPMGTVPGGWVWRQPSGHQVRITSYVDLAIAVGAVQLTFGQSFPGRRQIHGNGVHHRTWHRGVGVFHDQEHRRSCRRYAVPVQRWRKSFTVRCMARGDGGVVGKRHAADLDGSHAGAQAGQVGRKLVEPGALIAQRVPHGIGEFFQHMSGLEWMRSPS